MPYYFPPKVLRNRINIFYKHPQHSLPKKLTIEVTSTKVLSPLSQNLICMSISPFLETLLKDSLNESIKIVAMLFLQKRTKNDITLSYTWFSLI